MNKRALTAHHITAIGFTANVALSAFKLIAGIVGQSSAIIADAIHSLSDMITDIVVIFGIRLAGRPKDKTHDYGHGKIETFAAFIVGIVLFIVGGKIFFAGSFKVVAAWQGEMLRRPGLIALWAAFVSILVKEWMYRYTVRAGKKIKSRAVIANAWHHRSDAFSSIGTLAGVGGAIFLGEHWRILDPLAAIIVSFFIVRIAFSIISVSLNELLEASLDDATEKKIIRTILSVSGVKNPHNMKTRRIGNSIAIDVHIEVDKSLDITSAHDISTNVEEKLKGVFGRGTFVSLHIEPAK